MTQPTRRIRAGAPPPDSTGCLPVEFTREQIDEWDAEARRFAEQEQAELERDMRYLVAAGSILITAAIAIILWIFQ